MQISRSSNNGIYSNLDIKLGHFTTYKHLVKLGLHRIIKIPKLRKNVFLGRPKKIGRGLL